MLRKRSVGPVVGVESQSAFYVKSPGWAVVTGATGCSQGFKFALGSGLLAFTLVTRTLGSIVGIWPGWLRVSGPYLPCLS